MIRSLSRSAGWTYTHIAKPLLFLMPADFVHESMIKSGSLLQKITLVRRFLRKTHAYSHPMLETELDNIRYQNPLGLSAGLDKDGKIIPLVQAIGFGFIECGSVTYGTYRGNEKPWYTRLPKSKSILVNSGLRSEGATAVINRVRKYSNETLKNFPLNISIAKTNSADTCTVEEGVEDYINSLKAWEKSKLATLYTINISCPNTFGGEPFTTVEALEKLLSGIDALKIKKPIFVKMPIDKSWQETKKLLDVCKRHSVRGITLGNLYKDRTTIKLQDNFDNNLKGNFSGRPCQEKSDELLSKMYSLYHDRFIFSGVGGVFSAEDAYRKIRLGATFIEMITGLIFQGPTIPGQITYDLVKLLKKDGYSHYSEAIGVDVKKGKKS